MVSDAYTLAGAISAASSCFAASGSCSAVTIRKASAVLDAARGRRRERTRLVQQDVRARSAPEQLATHGADCVRQRCLLTTQVAVHRRQSGAGRAAAAAMGQIAACCRSAAACRSHSRPHRCRPDEVVDPEDAVAVGPDLEGEQAHTGVVLEDPSRWTCRRTLGRRKDPQSRSGGQNPPPVRSGGDLRRHFAGFLAEELPLGAHV